MIRPSVCVTVLKLLLRSNWLIVVWFFHFGGCLEEGQKNRLQVILQKAYDWVIIGIFLSWRWCRGCFSIDMKEYQETVLKQLLDPSPQSYYWIGLIMTYLGYLIPIDYSIWHVYHSFDSSACLNNPKDLSFWIRDTNSINDLVCYQYHLNYSLSNLTAEDSVN